VISVFKKNDLVNFILLLPYAIVLRLYSFLEPNAYVPGDQDSFLSSWLLGDVVSSPLAQAIVAILLLYGQAILINMLTTEHRIYRIPSALSGMVYILIMSSVPVFQQLTPALIGMSFVILSTFSVFNTYKKQSAKTAIFNAALSAAFAVLIYPPYALLVISFMMGLAALISFDWKSKLQFIFGFGVVFWVIGGFLYFFDVLDWSFFDQIGFVGSVGELLSSSFYEKAMLTGSLVLVVLALANYYNYRKKKGIEIRKKIDYFYWMLLTGFLSLFLFRSLELQHFLFLSLGLSIFIGLTFADLKNAFLGELAHILLIAGVFFLQFGL